MKRRDVDDELWNSFWSTRTSNSDEYERLLLTEIGSPQRIIVSALVQ